MDYFFNKTSFTIGLHNPWYFSTLHLSNTLGYNIIYSSCTWFHHSHRDHAGGNEKIASLVSGLMVCGNDDRIGALNKKVKSKDQLKVHLNIIIFNLKN